MKRISALSFVGLRVGVLLLAIASTRAASPRETPTVRLIRDVRGAVLPIFAEPEKGRLSSGTASVIHPDGFLLSNDHVMLGKPGVAIVGRDRFEFRVVGRLPGKDIAVLELKIPEAPAPIAVGRSQDLMTGEPILAAGNPGGRGVVFSQGIISAASIMRDVNALAMTHFKSGRDEFIQFDAASNPGNSGGPLINALGEQIGIVSAGVHNEENSNYAIPIDRVRKLFHQLLPVEVLGNIWTGLEVDMLADRARVARIHDGSPAAAAGLRAGDVLKLVSGKTLRNGLDWPLNLIRRDKPRSVDLVYLRKDREHTATLNLVPYPLAKVVDPQGKKPGLRYSVYEGRFEVMPDFSKLKVIGKGSTESLQTESIAKRDDYFAITFEGYIHFPADGVYRLILASDDGSRLFLDGQLTIDNDNNHPLQELSALIRVRKGLHPLRIEYFDYSGDALLQLHLADERDPRRPVPDHWFFQD